jgi:hypothetical protein
LREININLEQLVTLFRDFLAVSLIFASWHSVGTQFFEKVKGCAADDKGTAF